MARARIAISSPADLAALLRRAKVKTVGPIPGKRSKYKATRATYAGLHYDSRAEAAYAKWLDAEVTAGRVLWWVKAPAFRLGCPENVYRPDFIVAERFFSRYPPRKPEQLAVVVYLDDVKGKATRKFQHDCKLWAAYGPTTLRVVKLSLSYPRADPGGEAELPSIRKVDYTCIEGGLNR